VDPSVGPASFESNWSHHGGPPQQQLPPHPALQQQQMLQQQPMNMIPPHQMQHHMQQPPPTPTNLTQQLQAPQIPRLPPQLQSQQSSGTTPLQLLYVCT
jgi:hypothetical protein